MLIHEDVWSDGDVLYGYPPGYGYRLGTALESNTHESSLTLDLDSFFEDSERSHNFNMEVQPLVSFIEKNKGRALRSLTLKIPRDPPEISCDAKRGEWQDQMIFISDWLLRAAANNDTIKHLSCHGLIAPSGFHCLLSQTRSFKSLDIQLWNDRYTDCSIPFDKAEEKTLSAFSANQTFEKITLRSGKNADNGRLIQAVLLELGKGLETRTLRGLWLEGNGHDREAHCIAMTQFLLQTTTLQHLEFNGYYFHKNTCERLLNAFKTHFSTAASLVKLRLGCHCTGDATTSLIDYMRSPANDHEPTWQDLGVEGLDLCGNTGILLATMITPQSVSYNTPTLQRREKRLLGSVRFLQQFP